MSASARLVALQRGVGGRSNVVLAILAMIVSQASFTINDTLIKLARSELPGSEVIFIRGMFTLAFAAGLALIFGGLTPLPGRRDGKLLMIRGAGDVCGTFLYLSALFHMPISDATAILQFVPLAMTAGAAVFLGEAVGWRRWAATIVGFIGVLIVIRPGAEGFNVWSLAAFGAVIGISARDLATRRIGAGLSTLFVAATSALSVTSAALIVAPFEVWVRPSSYVVGLLIAASVFVFGGYFFVVEALRRAEVGSVAPFRYSVIIWALLSGFFVFGERPDAVALLGTGIVVAAGVYTALRERHLARLKRQSDDTAAKGETP